MFTYLVIDILMLFVATFMVSAGCSSHLRRKLAGDRRAEPPPEVTAFCNVETSPF
jgi:hypothetical protein